MPLLLRLRLSGIAAECLRYDLIERRKPRTESVGREIQINEFRGRSYVQSSSFSLTRRKFWDWSVKRGHVTR